MNISCNRSISFDFSTIINLYLENSIIYCFRLLLCQRSVNRLLIFPTTTTQTKIKMSWVPRDMVTLCHENDQFTTCAPAFFIFMSLITRYFSQSRDTTVRCLTIVYVYYCIRVHTYLYISINLLFPSSDLTIFTRFQVHIARRRQLCTLQFIL